MIFSYFYYYHYCHYYNHHNYNYLNYYHHNYYYIYDNNQNHLNSHFSNHFSLFSAYFRWVSTHYRMKAFFLDEEIDVVRDYNLGMREFFDSGRCGEVNYADVYNMTAALGSTHPDQVKVEMKMKINVFSIVLCSIDLPFYFLVHIILLYFVSFFFN